MSPEGLHSIECIDAFSDCNSSCQELACKTDKPKGQYFKL